MSNEPSSSVLPMRSALLCLLAACEGAPLSSGPTPADAGPQEVSGPALRAPIWPNFFPTALARRGAGFLVTGRFGKDMGLLALDVSGAVDDGCGGGGLVLVDFRGDPSPGAPLLARDYDAPFAVVAWPPSWLVAGVARGYDEGRQGSFGLALASDRGGLEPTFGIEGIQLSGWGAEAFIGAAVVDSEGRAITAGTVQQPSMRRGTDFALTRYDRLGNLDPDFSGEGGGPGTVVDVTPGDQAALLALAGDRIIVGGGEGFALAGFREDGGLDTEFGFFGRRSERDGFATAGALAADRVYLAGRAGDGRLQVSAWTLAGAPAPHFGVNGRVRRSLPLELADREVIGPANGMCVEEGGSVLVLVGVGPAASTPALVRLAPDGSIDRGFGEEGWVLLNAEEPGSDLQLRSPPGHRLLCEGDRAWSVHFDVSADLGAPGLVLLETFLPPR